MASGGATRVGPRRRRRGRAAVAPQGAARALLAPDQRFAGLAVRPPAGAGASDGDDGDAAASGGATASSTAVREAARARRRTRRRTLEGTWCWRMMARGAHLARLRLARPRGVPET